MAMLRLFVSLGAVCSGQRESEDNRTDFIWFSERGPGVPPPPAGEEGGIDSESCPSTTQPQIPEMGPEIQKNGTLKKIQNRFQKGAPRWNRDSAKPNFTSARFMGVKTTRTPRTLSPAH